MTRSPLKPDLITTFRSGNQMVTATFASPNTPEGFYWQERFGPKPTSEELWRKVHELTHQHDAHLQSVR